MRFPPLISLSSFLVVLLAVASASAAPTENGPVHEYVLENGLKVVVKEDHRAPVVVSQIWYKVGSSYEYRGVTGISHVLEHMMFQGTERHPPGEFSRIIAQNGGRENAFTGRDYTAYFQQLERSRLPISFELEADRMRHLLLPPEQFAKEIKVVMEERRLRTEDKPQALAYEQFMAAAYQAGGYRNPIIGWMEDLEALTVEDLARWYRTWYAPNNATLVVVGDVKGSEVRALARKYFGPIKPSIISAKPRGEIPQRGERRITVKAPAELPFLVMGYKAPVLRTAQEPWKPYALEVLAGVLDGGESARLTRDLVRGRQIAASAGASYDLHDRYDTLFQLQGVPARGHDVAELERAFREQIARLKKDRISEQELARIKAQVTAAKVYEQDSIFYQAMQIGMLETVGLDWRMADEYVERIGAVTPEQVRRAAQEFLADERLTVAMLEPLPLDRAADRPAQAEGGNHVAD